MDAHQLAEVASELRKRIKTARESADPEIDIPMLEAYVADLHRLFDGHPAWAQRISAELGIDLHSGRLMVAVSELGERCSFMEHYSTTNTPQPCGQPATSLVIDRDEPRLTQVRLWRCDDHRGHLDYRRDGEIVEALEERFAGQSTRR